jgi:transcriptional regulator with PAS, ATPase and Fis domain
VLLGAEKATNDDESDLRFLSGMVDVIDIPSIRQRKEDIPYILNKLVNDLSQKLNKHISLPEESLWQMVKEFPWSGNEQELLDFAHKIIMNGPIEAIQQLIDQMEGVQYANQIPKLNPFLCQLRENVERILVEKAMITTDKNRKKAASILGISYKSLCKKIKEVE